MDHKIRLDMMRRWVSMHDRCYNPNSVNYRYYGARGIVVCKRWFEFQPFWDDMGEPPWDEWNQKTCSIGRINNEGNYEPNNCRWETQVQQNRNTVRTKFLEYNGEIKSQVEWARQYNIGARRLNERLKRGWTIERALNTPCPKGFQGEYEYRSQICKRQWEINGHLWSARSRFKRGDNMTLLTMDLLQVEGFDPDSKIFHHSLKTKLKDPIIEKAQIPEGGKYYKVTNELIKKIISMKKAGRTIRDIARIVGLPRSTVFFHLKKHGVAGKK
jgi:hypothetical protein